jgi:dihydrodipicolinate synthase/N-acetylneuraminate lyase
MTAPISGIFVPFVVPLDGKGRINEDELYRYLNWLIERGVHGLYPNGSTGEFTRFTAEERKRIAKIACEAAAGRVPVLAGAAEANVAETLKACETYAGYGARAVAIVSPFYYRLSSDAIYAYFREIGVNSPIDVTLYNIPMFATPLDVPTISRLSEVDRIVGIKDSSGDISFMQRMLMAIRPRRPDFTFLAGWEPALTPMLFVGANGGTLASAGVVPEITKAIFELVNNRDFDAARRLQPRLIALFDMLLNAGDFPFGFRIGVESRGFEIGPSRQPSNPVPSDQRREISSAINELLESQNSFGETTGSSV